MNSVARLRNALSISSRRSSTVSILALLAVLGLALALAMNGQAQTTLLFEGFEGNFPADNSWSVGDLNPTNGVVYWDDVNSVFGNAPAHTGSWKGYCAGVGYVGTSSSPLYTNNMQAFASKSLDLTGYSGANLDFWYVIPSIETAYDHLKVYMDSTLLWTAPGQQTDWTLVTLPLNNFLGGTHTLNFEFDSDYSVFFEGAYLDDIVVRAHSQAFALSLLSLSSLNYSGYVLASDTALGRSNIQAQAVFTVENFSGTDATYTNILSYRLINASNNTVHPLYDFGNASTNASYTYNITNVVSMAAGTNFALTNIAYLRPAAWMSQFTPFFIECRMLTNGVLAQALTTAPQFYYHFTNTVSGDSAYNVLLNLTGDAWARTYAVQTIAGQNTFQVNASYEVRRWDDFAMAQSTANVPIVLKYTLHDSAGNNIPLANNSQTFFETIFNYGLVFVFPVPSLLSTSHILDIQPAAQLDSVNKTYYLTVTLSHTNNPVSGQVLSANTLTTATNELLHFNGNLFFASIGTTMNSLGVPPPVNPPGGGVIPTTLNGVGGFVTAKADHDYSGAGPLNVNLTSAGDALVTAGSLVLNAPSPDNDAVALVNFQRGPVTLSASGAMADVKVTLPTGLGYRTNDTASQVIFSMIQFTSVALTPALAPASDLIYAPGVPLYAAEESKPVWLLASRIVWRINAGKFDLPSAGVGARYVRADEFAYLQSVSNNLVDPPNMGDKRSNDKYWLALSGLANAPVVHPDLTSNALLTAHFVFGPGGFRAHFPYDTIVQWSGNGAMTVSNDLVVSSASSLSGAASVRVPYTRDCPDCGGAGAGLASPGIISSNGLFSFTLDGGLVAGGTTTPTLDIQWGYIGAPVNDYAQQARTFTAGAFHMPGIFVRGDLNLLANHQGPTTILYTGFAVSNLNVIERPLSVGYSQGFADYAGLNFRCLTDGAHPARSTIAGTKNINWQLDARSKYYVRYAGVTGIHEAVPGSFPSTLTLWGYKFNFTSYALSYLDSQNQDSLTDGAITLPYPAQFVQGFDNLKFSCLGAPVSGEVPQGDGFKVMAYWTADFKTHSISFKSNNGCSPTEGYLVLGLEGYASHLDKPLYGQVGFFAGGDQIPRSFGLNGVDSRLKVPNLFNMDGPNNTTYSFTPISDVFYNTWSNAPPGGAAGWVSIFGKIDVPFFEDMQMHLQTSCHTNGVAASNAPIYLSGGWPRPGSGDPNHGWLDGASHTPFETNFFDWGNAGWTSTGTIENYRDNQLGEDYHPRAQRVWLGVVDFDYPMSWNSSLRSFKSWQERTNDLLVLSVRHQVKYMDAKQAEIDFGAQYDGLPQISIANLAFNAIDQTTGVGDAIVKAAAQPVEDVLSSGLDELNQLLDTQMNRLMDGVFDRTVDPIIDHLYQTLSNQWAGAWDSLPIAARQQFVLSVSSNMANIFIGTGPSPVANNLSAALRDVGSAAGEADNLIHQVEGYLRDATNAICSIVGVISTTTNGQAIGSNVVGLISKVGNDRPVVPKLIQSLVGDIAPQFIDAVIGPALSNVLQGIEGPLAQVTETLNQTKDAISQVESQLHAAGNLTTEIDDTIKSFSSQLTNVSIQVSISVTQYFGQLDYTIDNPFQHLNPADVKQFIRQKIEDQFFATDAAAQVQTILRQRLYDLDAAMRQQIDSVFQELNGVLRSLISQSLAQLDNSINGLLGDVSDVIGAGKINGHALIDGDSLKCLRIDGHFEWKAPDSMEFDAFLQIKEYDSDGTPGCSSSNAPTTEVTIGANMVSLDWISPDLKCNIETKFTFDGGTPFPVNLAGQLELIGELDFEAFQLHDLAAALAFGKYENYLALKGGVRFDGYDFSGAIFFGRTCTLDPLLLIDPQVAGVLGNPPFTGAYVYAQGWLPISEIVLGIPASCIFEISAGVGAGAFYFAEGPTYGGKMFLGVSGELLCVVSIEGDITLIGVKHGDDLSFTGHGHFEADVGPCPFCISVSKDVDVSYVKKSWHLD